ncbi:DUF1822 family protein [Limnospira fusiformis KN01]|uniref:DUF1822 family protein n=1 Tax=Limnospira TaxID=2596745 RepID=UPI0016588C65|nr:MULTISPECIES: DUF1822 family protein [Limnospira]MDT9197270.1 DUF1822 family protein [Limnospira sp. PMC 1042.18]ULB44111.1 DUF1822 family protein [Limnospira fusiformis KN01]
MANHTQQIENSALPMLIGINSRRLAQQFAREQPNRQKAEQVYFNTLAICVVRNYLEWMGIATQVNPSDSWNPITRLASDVADLQVTGLGILECRPIRENQQICLIPPEVWGDRIGYVVVEIEDSLKAANILGFMNNIDRPEIPRSQLQPIEALLITLSGLRRQNLVNLSQWCQGIFEETWQDLGAIFSTQNIAYNFRNSPPDSQAEIEKAKLIDLQMQLGSQMVVLLVALTPEFDTMAVRVRLYPPDGEIYLPHNLRLALLSDQADTLEEVRSRRHDNYIQLPRFSGEIGERFSIQVALENAMIIENFQI